MYDLLDRALKFVIKSGTLRVTDPFGRIHEYGDGTGDPQAFTVKTSAAARQIALARGVPLKDVYAAAMAAFRK